MPIPISRSRRAIALALCLLSAGCASYSSCRDPACADDARLEADVTTALAQDKEFLAGSVVARTHERVVYLYGEADTEYERRQAETIARSVPGVAKVVNFIGLHNR